MKPNVEIIKLCESANNYTGGVSVDKKLLIKRLKIFILIFTITSVVVGLTVVKPYYERSISLINENMEQFTIEHNLPMIKYKVTFPYSLIEINTFYIDIYDAHFLEYSYSHNQELEKELNQMSIPYARIKSNIKYYSSPILDKNGNTVDTSRFSYSDEEYKDVAIKAMTDTLKSPSSAKFGILSLSRNDDNVVVRGYVDADNSFGANLRTEFAVIFYDGSIRNFDIITE